MIFRYVVVIAGLVAGAALMIIGCGSGASQSGSSADGGAGRSANGGSASTGGGAGHPANVSGGNGTAGQSATDPTWAQWPVPPSTSSGPYTDNGNGTVTDNTTGLTWQSPPAADRMGQTVALTYCANTLSMQALGGHSGWRLPTKIELLSIVDYGLSKPSINAVFSSTEAETYWTSTIDARDRSKAWSVDFFDGDTGTGTTDGNPLTGTELVRCVR